MRCLAEAFYGRFEHTTERTSSPLVQRGSNKRDTLLDKVHFRVACA